MLRNRALCALVLLAVPSAATATNLSYTFDAETELSSNFTANRNGVANANFTFDATGGVNGGGGIRYTSVTFPEVPTNGWDATNVHNNPVPVQDGQPYTLSAMVKTTSAWGTSWRFLQLGLVNRADRSFNGDLGDTGFIAPRINSNYAVQVQTKNVNAGPVQGTVVANADPAFQLFGNWLKFSVTIQQTDAVTGTFSYSMVLQDYGVDGLTPGVLYAVPAAGTVTLGGLANAPLYPGFRAAGPFVGDPPALTPVFFDNFSVVVPEPTSALLLLAPAALLVRRRQAR